ncbi:3-keto-disaccharide hydrolase [Flavobacterium beibuense]|uniref:3-keto-disaccharide hydrolase n=1 Tax=Flavobacterium beibuense TaxID=657326 RepID=UPI003A8E23D7
MFKTTIVALFLLVAISLTGCKQKQEEEQGWKYLLDNNMTQWGKYLSYKHTTDYNGNIPTDSLGNAIEPLGYDNDPEGVFTMIQENGEPVLKVSGERYGCVFTKEEFANYHLKVKVKWGDKKWIPREDKLKDTGILYHSVGESGKDYWRAWMLSQEFQIMEGHMGDYWNIANAAIDIRAFLPEGMMNAVAGHEQSFLPIGTGSEYGGFCLRSIDNESGQGEWTQLELICFGDKSLHIVNGKVVMVLQNSRYVEEGKNYPLTKGKIQLQSEAAEAYFKDVKIKNIEALPEEYTAYFN